MTDAMVLSTDGLPQRETAPAWHAWMARLFAGLETDLYGDSRFEGHVRVANAGDLVLTRLEAGRHRVIRSLQGLRSHESPYLKIVAPWKGTACVSQQGHESSASAGNWVIYDTTRAYEVANPGWSEHLIVMLPRQAIVERGIRLEGLMGRNVGGSSGIARIALEAMRSTYQELPGMAPALARRAGELLVDMVHLSLQELAGQGTAGTQKLALQDRIRAHVMAHLRDPGLSVEALAAALNCSKRHLHNAFADSQLSLGVFIQHSRLELCMRDLLRPELAQRTITDIAMDCGFGSSAHFSRAFKAYTGLSPSDFRAMGAGAQSPCGARRPGA
ncbi:AraC-like ligand-binding domain-containing protein [Comamonas composti]|uniref:AraC-like ligand-binding domain-containing protein n=1 Tax=Comamonas composti TaxID=408558 RepID=UPI00040BD977|nr:helix-turn-helix domain-containing protein [Comamonas composti]